MSKVYAESQPGIKFMNIIQIKTESRTLTKWFICSSRGYQRISPESQPGIKFMKIIQIKAESRTITKERILGAIREYPALG